MSKSFVELANEIGELVTEKNKKYGNSFGKTAEFLKILFPDGIKPEQYEDLGCIFRIFDKMMRLATAKDAFGESPYSDLAGYSLLGLKKDLDKVKVGANPPCSHDMNCPTGPDCNCDCPDWCACIVEGICTHGTESDQTGDVLAKALAEELKKVRDLPPDRPGGFLPGMPNNDPFDDPSDRSLVYCEHGMDHPTGKYCKCSRLCGCKTRGGCSAIDGRPIGIDDVFYKG